MSKTESISIRVHPGQKEALRTLAHTTGLSLSEYVRASALASGRSQIEEIRASAPRPPIAAPRLVRSSRMPDRPRPDPMSFRLPSMPGDYGAPFEEVVRFVAVKMRTDPHTVAIALTYVAEGIGRTLAQGRVFRWPGLFAAGPYRVEHERYTCCLPRFQSYPPLKQLVWEECPSELGRNRELDAHRRRRRPERSHSLETFLRQQRHAISLQDLRIIETLDSDWRMSSPTHWAS